VNKGTLQLALTGTVDLELEYREYRGNGSGITQEHAAAAQNFQRTQALMEIADAFAWLLHVTA
jgi:hypothetical protein